MWNLKEKKGEREGGRKEGGRKKGRWEGGRERGRGGERGEGGKGGEGNGTKMELIDPENRLVVARGWGWARWVQGVKMYKLQLQVSPEM